MIKLEEITADNLDMKELRYVFAKSESKRQ